MNMFALVRNPAELVRACGDLYELFAFRQKQEPALLADVLLGIWVDPLMPLEVPSVLTVHYPPVADQSIRIMESISLSGIWMLAGSRTSTYAVGRSWRRCCWHPV